MSSTRIKGTTIQVCVGTEVFTALTMEAPIFWDIAPCSPYIKRRFGGMYHLHLQGKITAEQETSVLADGLSKMEVYHLHFR
jgi:hypothetical protein